jgi:hypothetical protein
MANGQTSWGGNRRRYSGWLGVVLSCGSSAACTYYSEGDPDQCSVAYRGEIRVATWWGSTGSEETTIGSLQKLVTQCNQQATLRTVALGEAASDTGPVSLTGNAYTDKSALEADERRLLPKSCLEVAGVTDFDGQLLPCPQEQGADAPRSPIDVMLTNGGIAAKAYSCGEQWGDLDLARRSRSPNDLLDGEAIDETEFLPILNDAVKCANSPVPGMTLVAVPIGVHQINTLFVNVTKLCTLARDRPDLGINMALCAQGVPSTPYDEAMQRQYLQNPPPEFADFDSFAAFLEKLGGKPFAVADQPWVISELTFENVMVTLSKTSMDRGAESAYSWYWQYGVTNSDDMQRDDILRKTFERAARLKHVTELVTELVIEPVTEPMIEPVEPKVPPGNYGLWNLTRASTQTLFSVMGDWVTNDVLEWAGQDQTILKLRFPGTQAHFVFGTDVAVIPKHPFNGPGAAAAFVRAVTSHPGQTGLQDSKGARPALRGDSAELAEFEQEKLPGLTHLIPRNRFNKLDENLANWFRSEPVPNQQDGLLEELIGYMKGESPMPTNPPTGT